MNKRAQIAQLLGDIVGKNRGGLVFFSAQVVSVQGDTCTVKIDELDLPDVRLTPTTTQRDETLLLTPAIDSFVLVGSLSGDLNNLCVLASDTLASVELTIGDISVFIDKEGVVLNGGELGGLVKLDDVTKKINALENQLNQLKNILKAWTPAPNDGGAALKGAISTWAGQPIAITKSSDLENKKVKQ